MVTEYNVFIGLLGIWVVRRKGEYMENKNKIEIIQTGITAAKILLNGQDISDMVSGYTITHNANCVAKLELIVSKLFTDIVVDETCKVTIRQDGD